MAEYDLISTINALSTEDKKKVLQLLRKPGNLFLMEWNGGPTPVLASIGGKRLRRLGENGLITGTTSGDLGEYVRLIRNGGESGYIEKGQGFFQLLIIATSENDAFNRIGKPCMDITPARELLKIYINNAITPVATALKIHQPRLVMHHSSATRSTTTRRVRQSANTITKQSAAKRNTQRASNKAGAYNL